MDSLSLSILSIPLFHLLALLPHAGAIHLISAGNPANWDNRNPRSAGFRQRAEKRLGPAKFLLWERLEAAHANSFENMPLFYSTIIVGHLAGLHKVAGSGGLDASAAAFLVIRTVYLAVYAMNDTQVKSVPRSLLYFASVGVCYAVLFRAARILAMG